MTDGLVFAVNDEVIFILDGEIGKDINVTEVNDGTMEVMEACSNRRQLIMLDWQLLCDVTTLQVSVRIVLSNLMGKFVTLLMTPLVTWHRTVHFRTQYRHQQQYQHHQQYQQHQRYQHHQQYQQHINDTNIINDTNNTINTNTNDTNNTNNTNNNIILLRYRGYNY